MRILRRWWWLLPLLAILALGGFIIWASTPAGPMPEALAALESDAEVQVETEPWFVFRPLADNPTVSLVIYPGGHVDPRSYAPAAHALAQEGYLVVIVPMPLNLAVFAPDRAAEVIAALPEIGGWAVGGHSLGGAMAARFAYQNPEEVQALMLWAAYPASTDDLSGRPLAVTSIYATNDGLATQEKIAASRPLLPGTTRWVAIEGGNHAQFGWYGPQSGDGTATISREEQQRQIVAATLELLSSLATPGS
jgi:predicted alpha/beta-hydrolase family hydrolase